MTVTVHTIDLEYRRTPGSIAAYLVEGVDRPILIETGPGNTTDALTRGLADLGYAPGDLAAALVTHIHFDHAGAAGWLAQSGAQIYVHEFGAPHLVDPTRLVNSARRIYGDRMEEFWGDVLPVPEPQVTPVHGGDTVEMEGFKIRVIETPGHARHHHTYMIETDTERVGFSGDAAGTFVDDCPEYVSLPTPPPEFELAAWLASIARLEALGFTRLYPTHFGAVDDPQAHLARVRVALREHAAQMWLLMEEGLDPETIRTRYVDWFVGEAEAAGMPASRIGFYVKDTIAGMNVMGLVRYWTKIAEKRQAAGNET